MRLEALIAGSCVALFALVYWAQKNTDACRAECRAVGMYYNDSAGACLPDCAKVEYRVACWIPKRSP